MAGVRKRLISQEVVSVTSQQDEPLISNEDIIQIIEEVQQEVTCSKLHQLDRDMTRLLNIREQLLDNSADSPVYLTLLIHCILCEIAGSLFFLLPVNLILILSAAHIANFTFYTNLFLAQILDSFVKIIVKTAVCREQDELLAAEFPDISSYSFPSGHSSRMSMLGYVFLMFSPNGALLFILVIMSVVTVSVSRVVFGRHFLSDMVGGIAMGLVNGTLYVAFLWTEDQTLVDFFEIRTNAVNWVDGVVSGVL